MVRLVMAMALPTRAAADLAAARRAKEKVTVTRVRTSGIGCGTTGRSRREDTTGHKNNATDQENELIDLLTYFFLHLAVAARTGRKNRGKEDYIKDTIDRGAWENAVGMPRNPPRAQLPEARTREEMIEHEVTDIVNYGTVTSESETERMKGHEVRREVSICTAGHKYTLGEATGKKGEAE